MSLLQRLRELWTWHEIRGCPGRFVVSKAGDDVPPEQVLERIAGTEEMRCLINSARFGRQNQDDVFVAVFRDKSGGGLITFCKSDGKFVHTLNDPSGLERKLKGLGFAQMLED